jgi:hypothetical protein
LSGLYQAFFNKAYGRMESRKGKIMQTEDTGTIESDEAEKKHKVIRMPSVGQRFSLKGKNEEHWRFEVKSSKGFKLKLEQVDEKGKHTNTPLVQVGTKFNLRGENFRIMQRLEKTLLVYHACLLG